ncbi:MAG TPA: hypothetical protein VGL81_19085 [Polyangiaceae bacterium]|jgi:hypothetical protein
MMGADLRPFIGLLLGVAACSGPAVGEDVSATTDAGNSSDPDAGASPSPKGATFLTPSGGSPVGHLGTEWDASLLDDAAPEVGLPPRLGGDASWTNAVPSGMPLVVNSGGPTVTSPVFQSVTFANYDLTPSVDDFVSRVGLTSYWLSAVGEYGIGLARAATPVHIAEGGPKNIDDADIQVWLANELAANPALEPPSSGTVYVLFYPSATSVTFAGEEGCFTIGGYHNSIVVDGVNVSYAVIPECVTETATELQTTTSAASHEMIEAVTDPLPLTSTPAYLEVDAAHHFYSVVLGGGEVGDLCAQWPASFFVPDDLAYTVQRTWSNAAVAAGRDPCQPELDGETFFNAVATLTDTVHVGNGALVATTLGVAIAPGTSRTVDVTLYSEGDVGPWTVSAESIPVGGSSLTFAWDKTTGNNGDTLHLTITANYGDSSYGGEPFLIVSTLGAETNYWLGYAGQ